MDTFKLTTEPFIATAETIWQGTDYIATSQYAERLAELLNLGLAVEAKDKRKKV